MSGNTEDEHTASVDAVNGDDNIGQTTPTATALAANANVNTAMLNEIRNQIKTLLQKTSDQDKLTSSLSK